MVFEIIVVGLSKTIILLLIVLDILRADVKLKENGKGRVSPFTYFKCFILFMYIVSETIGLISTH
jgi:hypothetical protein